MAQSKAEIQQARFRHGRGLGLANVSVRVQTENLVRGGSVIGWTNITTTDLGRIEVQSSSFMERKSLGEGTKGSR